MAAARNAALGGDWNMQREPQADYGVTGSANVKVGVDGTPSRVAAVLLGSGAVLAAMKLLGFRFNVGITS